MLNKRRIFETLEKGEGDDRLSKRFDIFIMSMILLNVAAVILETVENIHNEFIEVFYYFEIVSIIIFSIEYLGRLWTCTYFEKYKHPFWGRIKFIFSFAGLIDLLAILPFYLPLVFAMDGRFLRMLRLFRVLRIFKMGRYSTAFNLIVKVVSKRKEELLITLTIVLVMLILASSMMYYIEHEAQPDNFSSIPETMWWGVATLTTVGYGDVYPVTGFGKVLGAFIAILGVGIFALPAGIIAAGFESEISKRLEEKEATKKRKSNSKS
ncbi:MAG: ion transporter [Cyclobacteriaceae bacterium]